MKDTKGSAKIKVTQLTTEDIVVLWGGANDIARNNSMVGMKLIFYQLIKFNSYQCDPIKCRS
jgi:hypothetical protein